MSGQSFVERSVYEDVTSKNSCAANAFFVIADYNEAIGQELSRPDHAKSRHLVFYPGQGNCCPSHDARRKGGKPNHS